MNYPTPDKIQNPSAPAMYVSVPEYRHEIDQPFVHTGKECCICHKPRGAFNIADHYLMSPNDYYVVCATCRQTDNFKILQGKAETETDLNALQVYLSLGHSHEEFIRIRSGFRTRAEAKQLKREAKVRYRSEKASKRESMLQYYMNNVHPVVIQASPITPTLSVIEKAKSIIVGLFKSKK